jgi:hypothetical protein
VTIAGRWFVSGPLVVGALFASGFRGLPFVGVIAFYELQDVPVFSGIARVRPPSLHRRPLDIQLRDRRHTREGDRQIMMCPLTDSKRR